MARLPYVIPEKATSPDVKSGVYYGPNGFLGLRGAPAVAAMARRARDEATAARAWEVSEHMTGVTYPFAV